LVRATSSGVADSARVVREVAVTWVRKPKKTAIPRAIAARAKTWPNFDVPCYLWIVKLKGFIMRREEKRREEKRREEKFV